MEKRTQGLYIKIPKSYTEFEMEQKAKELDRIEMYDSLNYDKLSQYDEVQSISWSCDAFIATKHDPFHQRLVDEDGNSIIDYDLKSIEPHDEFVIYTTTDGKKGASTYDGVEIIPPKYEFLVFQNSFFIARKAEDLYFDIFTISGTKLNNDYYVTNYFPYLQKNGEFGIKIKCIFSKGDLPFEKIVRAIPSVFAAHL